MSVEVPQPVNVPQPVETRAAWRGDVLMRGEDWVYPLSAVQLRELEGLGERFLADDPDLRLVRAGDYPLVECAAAGGGMAPRG